MSLIIQAMTIALVLQYSNKGAQMNLHNYTN